MISLCVGALIFTTDGVRIGPTGRVFWVFDNGNLWESRIEHIIKRCNC